MSVDVQFLSFRKMLGYGTTEIRCRQPAEFLGQAGFRTDTAQLLDRPTAKCRLLVLHRVRMSPFLAKVVALARARGAAVLYDIDDLISETSDGRSFAPQIIDAMKLADKVSVSGSYLRDRITEHHPNVSILRNKLSQSVLDSGRKAFETNQRMKDTITIGYFSGSAHHDADFAMITPDLLRLLEEFPQTQILVAGKITVDPAFRQFGHRFRLEPFRPYSDFIALLEEIDINLAPLDLSSGLARARSELKYLEAGAYAVPTIASPNAAFAHAIVDEQNGRLAQTAQWYPLLRKLVRDRDDRARLGANARTDVETRYGPQFATLEWTNLFNRMIDETPPSPRRTVTVFPAAVALATNARFAKLKITTRAAYRQIRAARG